MSEYIVLVLLITIGFGLRRMKTSGKIYFFIMCLLELLIQPDGLMLILEIGGKFPIHAFLIFFIGDLIVSLSSSIRTIIDKKYDAWWKKKHDL